MVTTAKRREEIVFKPHPGQAAALLSKAPYVFLIAGTGGGKTCFGPIWLAREMSQWPGEEWLAVSPTYAMLQRSLLPAFLNLFKRLDPKGEYHKVDQVWQGERGTVWFGSAEHPERNEGLHAKSCWLDECGQMHYQMFEVAKRRVALKRGSVLGTTTPYNMGWLKTEVYDRWVEGSEDYFVSQFPSILNPAYPQEEFERAKRTLPPWRFKMFFEGKFERPENLVYIDFDEARHIVDPFPIPKEWDRFMGVDFGYNNPTAALWIARDPDNRLYIYREYYASGRSLSEHAEAWRRMEDGERITRRYADPSGKQEIEEYRRLGFRLEPSLNDPMARVLAVIAAIREDRLFAFRGLVNYHSEREGYLWQERKDAPVKENDHLMNAKEYIILGLRRRGRLQIAWV